MCTHTDTEGKQSQENFKIFGKNTIFNEHPVPYNDGMRSPYIFTQSCPADRQVRLAFGSPARGHRKISGKQIFIRNQQLTGQTDGELKSSVEAALRRKIL